MVETTIPYKGLGITRNISFKTTTSVGGQKASVHLTAFCPNPLKYTDPDGKISQKVLEYFFNAAYNGDIARPNFWNKFFNSSDPKAEFKAFMSFIKNQGVERKNFDDPFVHEEIAASWDKIPEAVKKYLTGNPYTDIASNIGDHNKNKRLPGGYHITEENDGKIYVHHDKIDPLKSIFYAILHKGMEVTFGNDDRPNNLVNNKPNWVNEK
jgi:hypothetical protein